MADWLEIVNPSDLCHIRGEDRLAAQMAILLISSGRYALTDQDGNRVLPILMFGPVPWLIENGIVSSEETAKDDVEAWRSANWERLEKVLRTVTYGSRAECESQELALSLIDDSEKRKQFILANDDRRRTSLNQIVGMCHAFADELREKYGKEVDANV